jgi:hypothetical protein
MILVMISTASDLVHYKDRVSGLHQIPELSVTPIDPHQITGGNLKLSIFEHRRQGHTLCNVHDPGHRTEVSNPSRTCRY